MRGAVGQGRAIGLGGRSGTSGVKVFFLFFFFFFFLDRNHHYILVPDINTRIQRERKLKVDSH